MGSLCVITARGGSKRIPRKNIRDFCGKPIIAYSIEAALESELFEEVMVSTDDDEIADVARSYGAEVPFMRSAETSDDYATTADVLLEVLECYRKQGREFETLCCLYPTAPFVTAKKLREAAGMLNERDCDSVIAATEFDFPPQRAFQVQPDGLIGYAFPDYALSRSQDLPKLLHDCGSLSIIRTTAFKKYKTVVTPKCMPYVVNRIETQDIDSQEDWVLAEMKYQVVMGRRGDRS